MALSASTDWELRDTGNDLNAGAFVRGGSGTDYSQQDSPQVTFDGSTIAASNGSSSATITISGYTVSSADVDNHVKIASGTNFTAGTYRILSVNTGSNTWTLDRACTSGAGSAMVGRMGGARLTLNSINTDAVLGNICWMKKGTYVTTVRQDWSKDAYAWNGSNPSCLIGYYQTRGDNPKGSNRPTISCSTAGVDAFGFGGQGCFVQYIIIDGNDTARFGVIDTIGRSGCIASYLTVKRFANQGIRHTSAIFFRCRVTDMYTSGFGILAYYVTNMIECVADNNPNPGHSFGSDNGNIGAVNCIFAYNSYGVEAYSYLFVATFKNCIFYKNASHGLALSGGYNNTVLIENCVIYGNGGYGISGSTWPALCNADYNAIGANTSGDRVGMQAGPHDVSLSADPYTGVNATSIANADSVDDVFALFLPNNTSGGGAALRGVGYPNYRDIGAVQHQDTGGGGGGGGSVIITKSDIFNSWIKGF